MKSRNILFYGLLLLSSWSCTQTLESRFQQVIDSVYNANPGAVGIMVHVEAPESGISWSGAAGISDTVTRNTLDPGQPALIASSIKTYVSAAILRLVEIGKLNIEQPVGELLSKKTRQLFESGGYDLEAIRIKHLLSHTSGIRDYADASYIEFIDNNKTYRWSRNEQLERTILAGDPLGNPGDTYSYTDANYLLLTEIMEQITGKPFYTAMRELLKYEALGLNDTWMPTLEKEPEGVKPLAHQYWSEQGWDSYSVDISVDLYGGGGIACPPGDLAGFSWNLFNAHIIQDTSVLNLIYTEVPTKDPEPANYYLGLAPSTYHGLTGFGHGGFWGTTVLYFPDMNASVAIYILERDRRGLIRPVMSRIVGMLQTKD